MGNNVTLSARYQIIGVFGEYLQIHDTDRNVTLLATPKVYADMKSKQRKETVTVCNNNEQFGEDLDD